MILASGDSFDMVVLRVYDGAVHLTGWGFLLIVMLIIAIERS